MRRARAFVFGALLALGAAACAAAAPEIRVTPAEPRLGEVVFITVRFERELLRAACSWAGKSYPLLPDGDDYVAVLPVALGAKPGPARVVFYWKYVDGGMGSEAAPIRVQDRSFAVQRLRLPREQARKYSAPETERERRLIREALARVTPERFWQGGFAIPVQGRISTEFGLTRYVNDRLTSRHRGVDLAAPEGTPVLAAAEGVVSLADDSFLLHGQTVILDHGQGISSVYLHLSAIDVRPGDAVAREQVIGRVGATGVATGPHLHFGVYAHGEAIDPLFWTGLADRPGS